MRFHRRTESFDILDDASKALDFLRRASSENKLEEIENMDDVLDALDLIGHIEYLESVLKSHFINF